MRKRAEKLEVGKWYADMDRNLFTDACMLKYSHSDNGLDYFDDQRSVSKYALDENGLISFTSFGWFYYLLTEEEIIKYNLV